MLSGETYISGFRDGLPVVGLLPYPNTSDEIVGLLRPFISVPAEEMWKAKKIEPGFVIGYLRKHKVVRPRDKYYYEIFNQHLYLRSCNQVNEACNKIRSMCELYYHVSDHTDDLLCSRFSPGFLPSSTVPQLYYASISSLLSVLGFFGVGSYRIGEEDKKDYNLVRTQRGFKVISRAKHVRLLSKKRSRGWHERIPLLYQGLIENGIDLPKIDMASFRRLQLARFEFDYGIMAKPTMRGTYGMGLFMEHLPHVFNTTVSAIWHLQKLRKPLPNKCDIRFLELASAIAPRFKRIMDEWSVNSVELEATVSNALEVLE